MSSCELWRLGAREMSLHPLDTEDLRYELRDSVAISRSIVRSRQFITKACRTIAGIWNEIRRDPDVRVAIITSSGDRFFQPALM